MKAVDPIVCDFGRIVSEIRTRFVVSASRLIAGADKEPVVCEAVWDTGSFTTVISPSVVKELELVPLGKSPVHTANGTYLANRYSVDVMLPNGMVIQGVVVSEAELEVCDALVGMDIIAMGDFLVTNKERTRFAFRVPSEGLSPT